MRGHAAPSRSWTRRKFGPLGAKASIGGELEIREDLLAAEVLVGPEAIRPANVSDMGQERNQDILESSSGPHETTVAHVVCSLLV